jgi:hypothetical protein
MVASALGTWLRSIHGAISFNQRNSTNSALSIASQFSAPVLQTGSTTSAQKNDSVTAGWNATKRFVRAREVLVSAAVGSEYTNTKLCDAFQEAPTRLRWRRSYVDAITDTRRSDCKLPLKPESSPNAAIGGPCNPPITASTLHGHVARHKSGRTKKCRRIPHGLAAISSMLSAAQ